MGILLIGLIGCRDPSAPKLAGGMRLVSMSPAFTQMLVDLGYKDGIVGVGAYDPLAGKPAAVVGDLYQLDYEKLLAIQPTHVFLQPGKSGAPGKLQELARRHQWAIYAYEVETKHDAMTALHWIGGMIGARAEARKLADDLQRRWEAIEKLTDRGGKPQTLLVIGRNPMTCAGPNTFLSQMLTAAGGINALAGSANRYPVIDKEAALKIDPQVILLVTSDESESNKTPSLPASLMERVRIVSDEQALLPSTTMVRVMGKMAVTLHPDLKMEINAALNTKTQMAIP